MNEKHRVAVITQAPFPIGNVSTMRIISYLKSLVKNEIYTYVVVYCPTRMAAHIKNSSGIYEGIHYQYATDITWKKYNTIYKIIYLFIGLINSFSYLSKEKITTLILYGDNLFIVNLFFWLYSRIKKIRFIGDRSELPSANIRNSRFKLFIYGIKQKMFDGMIVMTKQLSQFYSLYSKRNNFLFLLPMTIDPTRFNGLMKKETMDKPYIATVFGTHNRDGLLETLQSYELYCKKGGRYEIRLIGDYHNMPNKNKLDELIHNSPYKSRIIILGKQPNDIIPYLLYNASILITTPNCYSSGGFPTKLGEYMLSGVPIISTNVGELSDYIVPNQDMIMCEPGNIDNISDALLKLEIDKNYARLLAINAQKTALKVFCADSYVNNFITFLFNER